MKQALNTINHDMISSTWHQVDFKKCRGDIIDFYNDFVVKNDEFILDSIIAFSERNRFIMCHFQFKGNFDISKLMDKISNFTGSK